MSAIIVKDLTYKIGESIILNNINMTIDNEEIVGIMGHNGSGKSTFLKMLDQRIKPTFGAIEIYGNAFLAEQDVNANLFPELTVYENFKLFKPDLKPQEIPKNSQHVSLLSGGEKQLLIMELLNLTQIDILLLDEHTSALDPKNGEIIMLKTIEFCRKNKMTSLIITHNDEHAKFFDSIIHFENGQLL